MSALPVVDPITAHDHRRYPSISLLVPLDGTTPWTARLRALQRDAIDRLRSEFGDKVDRRLLHRLDEAVTEASPPTGARSLAVFVNADGARCVGIGFSVRERAVVDDTFATRDLVHDHLRRPRSWVLALSLDDPRLFLGHGSVLHARPLPMRDTFEHPATKRDRQGRDPSAVVEARRARRLRAIDAALGEALGDTPDPVVIIGADPTLSRFLAATRQRSRVEGVVRRRPPRLDPETVADVAAPVLTDVIEARRTAALAALERAVGAGTAVSGIDEVWRRVGRGRGALLLVERGYEHPAMVGDDGLLRMATDATAPGVTDDVVDELIEMVLAGGGRVEILPDGALAAHQRIALVPPTRNKR